MATIYRGLNVNFYLNDIVNDRESLINLGLNPDDIDVINGISRGENGISKEEFKTISNLSLDAQKELFSLSRSGQNIEQILTQSNKIDYVNRVFDLDMEFNADVDDQLRAGAIKYKFYDYSRGAVRSADISTSRISSWSSIGDGVVTNDTPIIYGSQVEILGGKVKSTALGTTSSPFSKKYPAEVPTDTMTLNIDGTNRNFYVMRDIPLVAYGTFRNASFNHTVSALPITNSNGAQILPVWRIENLNDPNDFAHTFSGSPETGQSSVSLSGGYTFRDPRGRTLTRKIEFYFHPDYVKYIRLSGINMTDVPQASLTNVETLDFSFNQLQTLPALYGDLTPNLVSLDLRLNSFGVANQAGVNLTLNNFFSKSSGGHMDKLKTLNLQATFSANENIDLSYLTALENLYWRGYYNQYNYRRMSGTYFPVVNSSTIKNYDIGHHSFSWLPYQVNDASGLQNFTAHWTGLLGYEDSGGTFNRTLTFANSKSILASFSIAGGATNVVNVSDFTALSTYYHVYNYWMGGDRSIAGKFSGGSTQGALEKLGYVSFYATYINGQLNGEFSNKPALETLDLRWTTLGPGGFTTSEFSGSKSLANVYIQGGWFDTNNFFGNSVSSSGYNYSNGDNTVSDSQCFNGTNISTFWAIDNRGIRGFLPDFSVARNLYYLFLRNTDLTGEIPNFALNTKLQYLRLEDARFYGQIPGFNSASLRYVRLENNNFSLSLPEQNLRNCYLFYANGNNIVGAIPTWANCVNMQYLNLSSNNFTSYIPTAISTLRYLINFDVSNNSLSIPAIESILSDLVANYNTRTRRGVSINLLGNGVSETNLSEDALTNLNSLRSFGWSVLI